MKEKSRFEELLEELIKDKTPEEIVSQSGLLGELTKRLYERALQGEMTDHLGYEKHAPEGRNNKNSRNGKTTKRVKADTSEIELEVPRDREIVVVCRSGNRSQQGRDILLNAGYTQVTSMQGGLNEWRASGYPVEQ